MASRLFPHTLALDVAQHPALVRDDQDRTALHARTLNWPRWPLRRHSRGLLSAAEQPHALNTVFLITSRPKRSLPSAAQWAQPTHDRRGLGQIILDCYDVLNLPSQRVSPINRRPLWASGPVHVLRRAAVGGPHYVRAEAQAGGV